MDYFRRRCRRRRRRRRRQDFLVRNFVTVGQTDCKIDMHVSGNDSKCGAELTCSVYEFNPFDFCSADLVQVHERNIITIF